MEWKSFIEGRAFDAYTYFGAHPEEDHILFRTYAPHALRVTVTGEFNFWSETGMPESRKGVFVCRISGARVGQLYKYIIYGKDGSRREHCDPYGFAMEQGQGHCSIICDQSSYRFHDDYWMQHRSLNYDRPLNIYEMHIGSWQKKRPGRWQWYSYDELLEPLLKWLKENSYTHVEFLPFAEHPTDGSWGYQQTGFFAPTSRYGSCNQLKFLIDHLHQEGIGVIFDFVSVHFASDRYGLREYDGTCLYESSMKSRQKSDWGSICFDHSKGIVRSFLQSAANYWMNEYHADGLRVDAAGYLIYRKGRESGGENKDGQLFLRTLNQGLAERHPSAMRIAEDPTTYSGTTHPVDQGGLGFTYKWDMGWTYDTLSYFMLQPKTRPGQSRKLTLSTDYYFSQHYILPLSHDLCGGRSPSLLKRMPGKDASRRKQDKLLHMYMMVHPGKKMNFMGNDLAVSDSWNCMQELNWDLLSRKENACFHAFIMELNRIACTSSAFYEADHEPWSCRWLCCDDGGNSVYAMIRHSKDQHIAAVWNFSDQDRDHFIPAADIASAELLLNSEWPEFGGTCPHRHTVFHLEQGGLSVSLPKYCGLLLKIGYQQ